MKSESKFYTENKRSGKSESYIYRMGENCKTARSVQKRRFSVKMFYDRASPIGDVDEKVSCLRLKCTSSAVMNSGSKENGRGKDRARKKRSKSLMAGSEGRESESGSIECAKERRKQTRPDLSLAATCVPNCSLNKKREANPRICSNRTWPKVTCKVATFLFCYY